MLKNTISLGQGLAIEVPDVHLSQYFKGSPGFAGFLGVSLGLGCYIYPRLLGVSTRLGCYAGSMAKCVSC